LECSTCTETAPPLQPSPLKHPLPPAPQVRKGDSIGAFLKAVRDQLAPEFRELRALGTDGLMYIKEDLILPHHYTFYELIINKARGKSGPLFDFGCAFFARGGGACLSGGWRRLETDELEFAL